MRWLLTYCDGSSGYKSAQLLEPEEAKKLLVEVNELSEEDAEAELDDEGGRCREAIVLDSDEVLYPVPNEATPFVAEGDDE